MITRNPGTRTTGQPFDRTTIIAVWNKGTAVAGYDPNQYRKDACGKWIAFADYGKTTQNGWEVDHIKPVAKGGSDDLANLQPLYWENNRYKSDSYPAWTCKVRG